jgi:DNA repair protein RadA
LFEPASFNNNNKSSHRKKKIQRIPTGSKKLDELLFGGIETHAITEFYGPSGSGKTQICHTLSVMAIQAQPISKVIYLDTNATFRPERILAIAQARGFDNTSHTLSNILYVRAMTSIDQELMIGKLSSFIEKNSNTILLIIDSVINNYRAEFLGASMLSKRQQKLYQFMRILSAIAQTHGIAVVVTNQVNKSLIQTNHSSITMPTGGNIMARMSTYRVSLRRLHNTNRSFAKIVDSSHHREKGTRFKLCGKGIDDIDEADTLNDVQKL